MTNTLETRLLERVMGDSDQDGQTAIVALSDGEYLEKLTDLGYLPECEEGDDTAQKIVEIVCDMIG